MFLQKVAGYIRKRKKNVMFICIQYDTDKFPNLSEMITKGKNYLAHRIVELAAEHFKDFTFIPLSSMNLYFKGLTQTEEMNYE